MDNIRLNLKDVRWDGADWVHVAQDKCRWHALVNTVIYFQVPQTGKCLDEPRNYTLLKKDSLELV